MLFNSQIALRDSCSTGCFPQVGFVFIGHVLVKWMWLIWPRKGKRRMTTHTVRCSTCNKHHSNYFWCYDWKLCLRVSIKWGIPQTVSENGPNHFNWLTFKSYLVAAFSTGRTCLHFTFFGKVNAVNAPLVLFFSHNGQNMQAFFIKQCLAWPQSYSRAPCRQRQSNYSQCYACCYACWAPHESELTTGFPTDSHLSDVISSLSQHSSQFSQLKKKPKTVRLCNP